MVRPLMLKLGGLGAGVCVDGGGAVSAGKVSSRDVPVAVEG